MTTEVCLCDRPVVIKTSNPCLFRHGDNSGDFEAGRDSTCLQGLVENVCVGRHQEFGTELEGRGGNIVLSWRFPASLFLSSPPPLFLLLVMEKWPDWCWAARRGG